MGKPGAIALASKWAQAAAQPDEKTRARSILSKARSTSLPELFKTFVPDWLRQVLITIVVLTVLALFLVGVRKLWREWERGKWYGNLTNKTKWSMLPLRELPGGADGQTRIATNLVLDALGRIGHELDRQLWKPKLLLLRPTPPADYEPAIIDGFLSDSLHAIVFAPGAHDLCVEWELHDVQLDQAVQNLQLKTATGIDVGSVARFIRSTFQWFNTGAPTISGIAQIGTDKAVAIHLAASGGRIKCAAVTASTDAAPGIDPTQLSAERAAFKFLFRMRYPGMTTDEIDGFSALRQGVTQFAQYAGTVPGVGDNATTRTSSLAKAAFNLNFFRTSIPPNCNPPCASKEQTSLEITDDIRQAVLLAEGVAHALLGAEQHRLAHASGSAERDHLSDAVLAEQYFMSAIDCFRQLEDWPGTPNTEPFRQQAAYNEAIVWRQTGHAGRSVLMLTELLGERAPDTVRPGSDATRAAHPRSRLPDAIRIPARVARVAAFAQYDSENWSTLPESRAELIINDAEKLVNELDETCRKDQVSAHDLRLASYMYIEALRALGHVELMRVITGPAKNLYHNGRPTGLKDADLNPGAMTQVQGAIFHLLTCEQLAPSCDLYCDLAEAYLLIKDFGAAEGYARHATLESDQQNESAYYIAAESFFLHSTDESKALAKKYAENFKGTVKLEKFRSLRTDLGIPETPPSTSTPQIAPSALSAHV